MSTLAFAGVFPRDWELRKFKYCAQESAERNGTNINRPMLSVSEYHGVVLKEYDSENRRRTQEELENYLVVRPQDLALNTMWLNHCGLGVARDEGLVSPAYRVYRLNQQTLLPAFVHHLFRSHHFVEEYTRLGYGIRPNSLQVSAEDFGALPVPLISLSHQRAIATFLDRKAAAIDALIGKKERLIDLLQEKRQALITQAVTKGLAPSLQMKESGLPWVGRIPSHWVLRRLKHLSHRISGRLVYQPAQYFADDGVPFIMGNNVTERGILLGQTKFIPPEVNARFRHHALRAGDIVMVRVGAPGVTAVVSPDADGLNCASVMIVRAGGTFDSTWLAAVMNSPVVRTQIDLVQYGAAQEQINITDAVNFWIPTPPLEEQRQVARFVKSATERIDATVDKITEQLARLREYREALITAAVTGKIDVSNEAA